MIIFKIIDAMGIIYNIVPKPSMASIFTSKIQKFFEHEELL